jgi:hypothetical protein
MNQDLSLGDAFLANPPEVTTPSATNIEISSSAIHQHQSVCVRTPPQNVCRHRFNANDPHPLLQQHQNHQIDEYSMEIPTDLVPFSPGERASIQPIMYAYAYHFGPANIHILPGVPLNGDEEQGSCLPMEPHIIDEYSMVSATDLEHILAGVTFHGDVQ